MTLDFRDSDEPALPAHLVPAPQWLINRYARSSRITGIVAETLGMIAEQQTKRRQASTKWHAALERDHGVIVDAASGLYVYSDERRAVHQPPKVIEQRKHRATAKPVRVKCSRCSELAAIGKTSCEFHLEWDRRRAATRRAA